MTVAELIAELEKMDSDRQVLIGAEDGGEWFQLERISSSYRSEAAEIGGPAVFLWLGEKA